MSPRLPGLPAVMGSFAALVVAFLSLLAQASTPSFVTRTVSAFAVFAAFGVVIRLLLADAAVRASQASSASEPELESITPGASVSDLLAAEESEFDGSPAPLA